MARLHYQIDDANVASKDLGWGVFQLGRAEDNDVQINHPSVSSHHCEIELALDTLTVRDLNSTNGTFVGDQRVQSAALQPGQVLRLGQVVVTVERVRETISIPRLEVPRPQQSVRMADGAWSCHFHNEVRAGWLCPKCLGKFCSDCIRELRLIRGRTHKLCPACSTHVEPLVSDVGDQGKSVWSRVKDFLRGA